MPEFNELAGLLEDRHLGSLTQAPRRVAGGDTAAAFCVETDEGRFFAKRTSLDCQSQLTSEAFALTRIAETGSIVVPAVTFCDASGSEVWLVLEWLNLRALDSVTEPALGRALASLHRNSDSAFGWPETNWLGGSLQFNATTDSWSDFFSTQRLEPQLKWAIDQGYDGRLQRQGRRLLDRLPGLLSAHHPEPALVHGDLWSGNAAATESGVPIVFDPAAHFADRESDLAMMRLFGGFGPSCFAGYAEAWPLPDGHEHRVRLYQLYHLLNHLNLFGSGYLPRCLSVMQSLI
ncbi:MAG: fructosamine kinase family protein [Pseudomonadota bacterium]